MEPRNYAILLVAAILEVAGDTIIRDALKQWEDGWKTAAPLILVAGVTVLGVYGVFVNKTSLDFATTLGLYVAFFGVVGAIVASCRERRVDLWTVIGVLIIAGGGLVINHGERLRQAAKAG